MNHEVDASAMRTRSRVRLDSLTSLRFFAAMLVVLSHTTRDLVEVPLLTQVARGGGVGVGFFFALSGFVLMWSHRPQDPVLKFYRRRFARVYPLHLLTYLLAFPVLLFAGTNMAGSSVSEPGAIISPFLIQAWFPQPDIHYSMNAPSWSLSNEAFFYLVFPLLVLPLACLKQHAARRVLLVLLSVYLVGAIVWSGLHGNESVLYLLPTWRLLGFAAGAVLSRYIQTGGVSRVRLPVAVIIASMAFLTIPVLAKLAVVLGGAEFATAGVFDAIMLPVFLLLIASAAARDISGKKGALAWRPLTRLGEWSFALYLTHWLLIDVIVGLVPSVRHLPPAPALGANLVVVLAAIGLSGVTYTMVERPLEAVLRGARPRAEELPATIVLE